MNNRLDEHVAAYEGRSPFDFDNEILLTWYPKRIRALTLNATSLLELGLGHGFSTSYFSTQYARHVVLEGSAAVIANFKKNHPACRAALIETYFENFDRDERFDVIVMGFILEHVDDPLAILRRFRRFLAPGGKMFIAVPNAEVLNRRLGHIAGLLADIKSLSDHDKLLGHRRYYTVESLTADVVAAGYRVKSMEGIYLKPFTSQQIQSLNFDRRILDALCEVGIAYPELCCGILSQIEVAA
ncbi:MAG: class I SAM-dependent methyltransferase [Steroidobacteraceae bacterium]